MLVSMSWRTFGMSGIWPLPSLPQITLGILPKIQWKQTTTHTDSRLEELKELIERNNGKKPFMIDNGTILRAAPKKKLSKSRHRIKLYSPGVKQAHPLNNIVRCPACGAAKRSHFFCMNCFDEIKTFLKIKKREAGIIKDVKPVQTDLDPIDEKIIYPGKYESNTERKLREKEYILKREPAILYEKSQVKPQKRDKKFNIDK